MTTPDNEPQERPQDSVRPGSYGEIAPGVPRYGQYAPEGWVPPSAMNDAVPSTVLPSASSYPGFPQAGMGHPQAGAFPAGPTTSRPKQVLLATSLIMIAGALQIFSGVLLLVAALLPAARDMVAQELKASMPSGADYDSILGSTAILTSMLVVAAVISLIAGAVYFWLAVKIRGGANWARTTALVLAGISLLALFQLNFFTILQVGLGVAAMLMLYRSPAKEFFVKKVPRQNGF